MNPKTSGLITVVAGVAIIALSVMLMMDRNKQREDLKVTTGKLDATTAELGTTKQNLAKTTDDLNATKMRLETTSAELATTTQKLTDETARATKLDGDLKAATEELNTTKTALETASKDLTDTKASLDAKTAQAAKLDEDLTKLKAENAVTTKDLEVAKARIKGYIGEVQALPEDLTGKVLAVNNEWQFVVIDRGLKDGLLPAGRMIVGRGDASVGTISISQRVLDHMAIADVTMQNDPKIPVAVGDSVFVR